MMKGEKTQEVFEYLDDLRELGATNMFSAELYVQEAFGLTKQEAESIVLEWKFTFTDRHP